VAIRPPKHNTEGFTLIEMIAILIVVGVISGFALPSLLSLNKPLRDGVSQFKSQLNLIRAKAISSGKAYRIVPLYKTRAEYYNAKTNPSSIPRNFTVEYAPNCSVTTRGKDDAKDGWDPASQFDLDLPKDVGLATSVEIAGITAKNSAMTVDDDLTKWSICFDNRGLISRSMNFALKDYQSNHRAKISVFQVLPVGGSTVSNYDKSGNLIPESDGF
jgi:type II secretory pathway pseudopilin PulG